jgi:hypothetical protein
MYSDVEPSVQRIAKQRMYQLVAQYPFQLSLEAIEGAFSSLPMDVYRVGVK